MHQWPTTAPVLFLEPELLPVEALRTLLLNQAAQERGYRMPAQA